MIPHFSTLAPDYDVLLCDVWGVVHNGIAAFPHACDALMRARARGAIVILITNAPRQSEVVARQLEKLHVPRETYDAIASSGDVTRAVIEQRSGQSVFHMGPERDRSIFTGLNMRMAPLESADFVVCGLDDDDIETPDDYRARLGSSASCSWSAAIRTWWARARRQVGLLRRLDRRSLRHHGRRGALCRQAIGRS